MDVRGQCHSAQKIMGDTTWPKMHQHTKCGSYRRYVQETIFQEIRPMPKWHDTKPPQDATIHQI